MTDDANGFRLIHQRCDFQYVHYVDGRESSATIIWRRDPAAAAGSYDAVVAVAGMILSSLASFSLVPRVRASPGFFGCSKKNEKEEKCEKFIGFHENKKRREKHKLRRVTYARDETDEAINFRMTEKKNYNRVWDDYGFVA